MNKDVPRPATLEDVAREAGVSRAAVSKVVRNAYGVSDAMRERVNTAIAKTHYRPNLPAQAMMGASRTIGFEIAMLENPALARMVQSASDEAGKWGYQIFAAPSGEADGIAAVDRLVDLRVAGIIAIAPTMPEEHLVEVAEHTPLVMLARHRPSPLFDTVSGDDETGTRLIMHHLLELGHRRIVHLTRDDQFTDPRSGTPHSVRLATYRSCMAAAALDSEMRVYRTGPDEASAAEATAAILDGPDRPTAIFASTDEQALGVLRTAIERGLTPAELSVAGYDDIRIASHPGISLTTVAQSVQQQGTLAMTLLLERIEGRRDSRDASTVPTLQVRGSTAHPVN